MADDKAAREFSHLKDLARKAKLKDKIAGLSENSRGSKLAKILSEAQRKIKTNVAGGYLTSLTGVVDTLEEIPPSEWSRGADIIKEILDVALRDPYLQGTDDLLNLGLIGNDLISEVLRQAKYTTRATKALANTAKRLGRGALDKGADYRSYGGRIARTFAFGVRTVSKIARAGLTRSDRKAEAQKTAAGARARALSDVGSERKYGRSADEWESEAGGGDSPAQTATADSTAATVVKVDELINVVKSTSTPKVGPTVGRDPITGRFTRLMEEENQNAAVRKRDDQYSEEEARNEAQPDQIVPLLQELVDKDAEGMEKKGGILSGLFGALGKLGGSFGILSGLLGAATIAGTVIAAITALGAAARAAKGVWDWVSDMMPDSGVGAKMGMMGGLGRGFTTALRGVGAVVKGLGKKIATSKFGGMIATSKVARVAARVIRPIPGLGMIGAGVAAIGDTWNIIEQQKKMEEALALGTEEGNREAELRRKSILASRISRGSAGVEVALGASGVGLPGQMATAAAGLTANWQASNFARDADAILAGRAGRVASEGGDSPARTTDDSSYDGLTLKGGATGQATAGGSVEPGVIDFARQIQGNVSDFNRFTGFNDVFHQDNESNSLHTKGLAMDFTVHETGNAGEAVNTVEQLAKNAGLKLGDDIDVIDEYKNPSPGSTGGHIHVEFNNKNAAAKFLGPSPTLLARGAGQGAASITPSSTRNAATFATASNRQATRGQTVNVVGGPITPVINAPRGGTTILPVVQRIQPDSIEPTLRAINLVNAV